MSDENTEPLACTCGYEADTADELEEHVEFYEDREDHQIAPDGGDYPDMTDEPETDDSTEENSTTSADSAEEGLDIAWTGGDSYVVFSGKEDTDSRVYRVRLNRYEGLPTCTCPHGEKTAEDKACKHIQAAVRAHHDGPELEASVMEQAAGIVNAAEKALQRAEGAAQGNASGSTTEQTDAGSDDTDDDGSEVTEYDDTNMAQDELVDQLEEWFHEASEFNDFDPEIVNLTWAEANGTEGIVVERSPMWDGTYHDGDEWVDKDDFDDAKEAVKEAILTPRDEFRWYGEPDYCYFIPKSDALEVVE